MWISEEKAVREQYRSEANLRTRISIHEKYSTNRQSFGDWIMENYIIPEGARLLELGCGDGTIWKNHLDLLKSCGEVFLTDISEGMLSAARSALGDFANVQYRTADIQDIPFAENSFDVVIANMMLYHVPDLQKGLAEARRVLKPGGRFYAATGSRVNIRQFVADRLRPYGVDDQTEIPFLLENGGEKLAQHFSEVKMLRREDALDVTDLDDLLDYIFSGIFFAENCTLDRDEIRRILEKERIGGVLHIPKVYGMFVCKK